MEELFINVMERLSCLTDISLIDENKGQLTNYQDGYPITFPAILIDMPEVEWDNATRTGQDGVVTLSVSLVIDCYHDTHYGSSQTEQVEEHMQLLSSATSLLQGWSPTNDGGKLCRQSSRMYSDEHGIRVYETTYQCKVKESFEMSYEGKLSVNMKADKG